MSVANRSPVAVLRALVTEIQEKQITFIAASLAYYSFVSLIPLLLLVISIAAIVGGPALGAQITTAAGGSLPESVREILGNTLESSGAASASIGVGLVFLLWSALKVFRGMDVAFSEVYGDPGPEGFAEQVKDAAITLGGVIAGIAITIVIGAVISFIESNNVLAMIGLGFLEGVFGFAVSLVSIGGLAVALFPLYYFLPTDDVTVREAIPGAIFAAVGWTALQTGFRIYASQAGSSAYGIIGAALLVLTFLYFGSLVLLIGVTLNAVLAGRPDDDSTEDDDEENAGETNRDEGVFRRRVKERTQAILDERDAEREAKRDGERAITDGGRVDDERTRRPDAGDPTARDRTANDRRRLVTDGGVERESENENEVERTVAGEGERGDALSEQEATTETGVKTSTGSRTETGTTDPVDSTETDTADPARPEAATATGLDGREYTLSEEYTLQREIERLRAELDAFEMEVEERVVDRDELESDLKSYVKKRVRSGKARGWGPYLVLLYGTAMTIAIALGDALSGGWAVFAIIVIFLSTLGLYVLMVMVGLGLSALSVPGKIQNLVASLRS